MTPASFASYIRFMTRTNSTTFSDANLLALMNIRLDELGRSIVDVDENILITPQLNSLVANQREYPLPSDMLSSFDRIEAKLDGTNFVKLEEIDQREMDRSLLTEAVITENYSNLEGGARYSLGRNSIFIFSGTITDVTDGLAIMVNTWPAAITSLVGTTDMSVDPSNTTHGVPRALHEIWARGVIIDWKSSREKPIPLTERELSYNTDKYKAISDLKPQNRDREVIGSVPHNDGSQY